MLNERIAARRAQVRDRRRRRRLRRTVLVLILVAVGVVALIIERSPLVALEDVRVAGTIRLNPDDVRQTAALPLGTSTLLLPLDAARERVEAMPLVASARVRRSDPLSVVVEVTERVPVAIVETRDAAVMVDADGVVVASGAESDLTSIRVQADRLPLPGQQVTGAAANALAVRAGLPTILRTQVLKYQADSELVLGLRDGTRVRFGRAERVDEKVRALEAVMDDLAGNAVASIDVRAPSRPVVMPLAATSEPA